MHAETRTQHFVIVDDEAFELQRVQPGLLHQVAPATGQLPMIVEHESVCGRLKLHAPVNTPSRIVLRVVAASHAHTFAAAAQKKVRLALQGQVVRHDHDVLLLSHGGLLLRLKGSGGVPKSVGGRQVVTTLS